jgi:hypothetical protein
MVSLGHSASTEPPWLFVGREEGLGQSSNMSRDEPFEAKLYDKCGADENDRIVQQIDIIAIQQSSKQAYHTACTKEDTSSSPYVEKVLSLQGS